MTKPDANYRSIADVTGYSVYGETIDPRLDGVDPSQIDDVLKLSHARDVAVRGCVIRAGGLQRENAIDMNRACANVLIEDCRLEAGQQNAVTVKGGCIGVTLRGVTIDRAGGHCDIELGNWSDQNFDQVRDVKLIEVRRADGMPVRVRIGNSERPAIVGGNVKILWFESLLLKLYWRAKYIFTRFVLRHSPPITNI